jgi:hypothetical protein
MTIREKLNLQLAWKRYKKDLIEQSFSDHPFEAGLIEENLEHWLNRLAGKLDNYLPSRAEVINVDKPNYHLRPGTRLSTEDGVIYQALLLSDIAVIQKKLAWSAAGQRFAHILSEDQTSVSWCVNDFASWNNFRKASLNHIAQGYEYVVFADVSAYFENISLSRLHSDLKTFGVNDKVLNVLMTCLNRWAEPRNRGIPQGYRPSFILGEVYFDSVDRRLANDGIVFCRYVDDMRIFCKTKQDAISALHNLTILLREKELNLQTAKSFILTAEEARVEIEGIVPVISELEGSLSAELEEIIGSSVEYATPSLIQSVLSEHEESLKLKSLQLVFEKYFSVDQGEFNKSLFHYCLNRLGAAGDDFASERCLEIAVSQPQELKSILQYFSKLTVVQSDLLDQLCDRFLRAKFISDHQTYLLLRHIWIDKIETDTSLKFARKCTKNGNLDDYTRDYARAIIGASGDTSDLDALEAEYGRTTRLVSKATILCSIGRMVKTRRNSVYSRATGEGELIDYAIQRGKQ